MKTRWRLGTVLGLVLTVLVTLSGVAAADTGGPPVAANASAIGDWPQALQQLVAGTAAFRTGPWYTDPGCKGHGGNVGIYINTYLAHEKDFWLQLAKSTNQGSNAGDAQKFIDAAGGASGFNTWPGAAGIATYGMPTKGTCADTLKAWGTPDATSVWGFKWVDTPDEPSMTKMMQIGTPTGDDLDPHNVAKWGNNSDTAYLKSRAFYLNCDPAGVNTKAGRQCQNWNYGVQNLIVGTDQWKVAHASFWSNVGLFVKMVGFGVFTAPAWVMVGAGFVLGLVGKGLQAVADYAAKKGMDQVVAFFTSGLITMWGAFTSWMVNFTTPNLATGGFMAIYDLIAGIMYGLAFLGWLLALTVAWRRGKLGRSLLGGVRAVLAIQLISIIAVSMLTLARECTKLLIAGHVDSIGSAKFATSLVAVNPVVGLLAAVFGIIGLLVALLILIFQIPLVFGHALFGVIAGAGQANPATSGWLLKWFFTFLSVCWTPFFMVGLSILGQDLVAGLDSNTQQNVGQQMATVLGGLLIMLLLPTTPWLLSGIMSVTAGRVSAAADAIGEKVGGDMMSAAGDAGRSGMESAGRAAAAGGSETWGALASMGSNLMLLDQMSNSAGTGESGSGAARSGGNTAGSGSGSAAGAGGGRPGGDTSSLAGDVAQGAASGGPAGAVAAAASALVGGAAKMAQPTPPDGDEGSAPGEAAVEGGTGAAALGVTGALGDAAPGTEAAAGGVALPGVGQSEEQGGEGGEQTPALPGGGDERTATSAGVEQAGIGQAGMEQEPSATQSAEGGEQTPAVPGGSDERTATSAGVEQAGIGQAGMEQEPATVAAGGDTAGLGEDVGGRHHADQGVGGSAAVEPAAAEVGTGTGLGSGESSASPGSTVGGSTPMGVSDDSAGISAGPGIGADVSSPLTPDAQSGPEIAAGPGPAGQTGSGASSPGPDAVDPAPGVGGGAQQSVAPMPPMTAPGLDTSWFDPLAPTSAQMAASRGQDAASPDWISDPPEPPPPAPARPTDPAAATSSAPVSLPVPAGRSIPASPAANPASSTVRRDRRGGPSEGQS